MQEENTDKDAGSIPNHIAIIMDGNGRWAKSRGLPRAVGHKKGADAVRSAVEGCIEHGVKVLTLYAFSSENWSRPEEEVSDLMSLLSLYIKKEVGSLKKQGVRLRFIGQRARLAKDIIKQIEDAEERTSHNDKMTLAIAINYSGREELVDAIQKIAGAVKDGGMAIEDISSDSVAASLYTADWQDPDLIIRTSGEQRLSNFMLWQAAYSELLFMDLLWPDFNKKSLDEAIEAYQHRERRFGARL